MANTIINYDEIRFIVTDPQFTDVYVYISARNDVPIHVQGWHHKRYPANLPTSHVHAILMTTKDDSPLYWPIKPPPDVQSQEASQLARAVLHFDLGLTPGDRHWAELEALKMMAEGVVGRREQFN
jgi:hypothetical protein